MNITIRDTNLNKTSIIDVVDSFIWTDRYYKAGDFEIYTEVSLEYIKALREDYYLTIDESEHVMVIESINIKTDVENGNKFIVKGRSLESILERRIVWKQTVLSGSLQDGIKRLLDENAINPKDPDRKMIRLIFEESLDPNILSLSVDEQYYGESLYDVIQKLCEKNSIGFKITLDSEKHFVFKLYSGTDRSFNQLDNPVVLFSPALDNLANSNYFHSKISHRTMALVGGEGEGSAKVTTQVSLPGGAGADLNRREMFTDASDVSSMVDGTKISDDEYNTLLVERGLLSLLVNHQVSTFDGVVDPSTNYIYGRDFSMGDIVQIENEYGLKGQSRITELITSEDLSGKNTYPTFEMIE